MKILVLNCGSSSIKYQLLSMNNSDEAKILAKGIVERIGIKNGELTHKTIDEKTYSFVTDIPDHTKGIDLILAALLSPDHGVIKNVDEIVAVGHRVAHGGQYFAESALITKDVIDKIEECVELAPLHNPANLKGILAMEKLIPSVPQVAVFDTSFHQTMEPKVFLYGLPYEYYQKYKVRRYGFHGTSHKYVAEKACKLVGWDWNEKKVISCHLGNGASVAAIKNGKSIDTSMGFTPVEGLMMGTRAGDLDLGALLFIAEKEDLTIKDTNDTINKRSGLIGVSGISSDMRDIEKAAAEGNERAKIAFEMFAYRVKKYIGAYSAAMGGVDLILFTGGIGENGCEMRSLVCSDLKYLGVDFDIEKNRGKRGVDLELTKPTSKTKVMVVTTNEELVIARDTQRIVGNI
ncbi:MAG: acetate kinase [Bacteroidetes bacterium GWF2_33_16]|nr:MAG: acetate kinase [Bacteroidetes bacterium GWE2_32_14]OFY07145.1 MAG: acetate kinase [Bacteroidetes bacterium GWF2_33_16]